MSRATRSDVDHDHRVVLGDQRLLRANQRRWWAVSEPEMSVPGADEDAGRKRYLGTERVLVGGNRATGHGDPLRRKGLPAGPLGPGRKRRQDRRGDHLVAARSRVIVLV